jgi:uncharacterized protein YecE (DUF72 family)
MALLVGTSGWAYPEWKPAFYPADLPRGRFLEHYGRTLGACEINATFYRLQSAETLGRWAAGVPDGFRFAVKAHRALTHSRGELDPGGSLATRFTESISHLGNRLGCVLIQLPPTRARDDGLLGRLLTVLPASVPAALEFRHPSWDDPAVRARVIDAGGTVCVADTTGRVPDALPEGRIAYVRLRAETYPDGARAGWLGLLRRESADRDVFVFAKHEGVAAGDPHAGVGLAEWMSGRIGSSSGVS